LKGNSQKFPTNESKKNAKTFINALGMATYETMDEFPLGIDGNIKPDEYLMLVNELKWNFHPEISSGTSDKLIMQRIITGRYAVDNNCKDDVHNKGIL
jgi:hypothetical protein